MFSLFFGCLQSSQACLGSPRRVSEALCAYSIVSLGVRWSSRPAGCMPRACSRGQYAAVL